MSRTIPLLTVSVALLISLPPAAAVTVETVPIGNILAPLDSNGRGLVPYEYRIGKYEVTNAQYVEFLNAIAATDTYGVFNDFMATDPYRGILRSGLPGSYVYTVRPDSVGVGPGGTDYSYANKPVVDVNWYSAVRFVNWLHNGQPTGSQGATTTEGGAYTITGGTDVSFFRTNEARWFLPNQDEWYKAAYYDGDSETYYDYPTGTNTAPDNNFPTTDSGNSANYYDGEYTTGTGFYPLTDVGAYTVSAGPNGTFDQGGNVSEWTETRIAGGTAALGRGGSWTEGSFSLSSGDLSTAALTYQVSHRGFRVGAIIDIPEPSTVTLAALGLAALAVFILRRPMR